MGLINWLEYKVLDIEHTVGRVATRMGVVPVQWPHDRRPGLIWRIPEPESVPVAERVTIASIFSKKQAVLVREYERAVVLENGRSLGLLEPGAYDLEKARIKGQIEVIWVQIQQSQHPWGVGGVMSREMVTVGGYGKVFLKVNDPEKFVYNLCAGNQTMTSEQIDDWVKDLVAGVMRRQFAQRTVQQLMLEREGFVEACKQELTPLFGEWGVGFDHLEVVDFNIPTEYRQAAQSISIAGFESQKALIDAGRDAQVKQMMASAEASSRLTLGAADVQVMAMLQDRGIDPLKVKMIETLMEYAKNPSQGGGLISGDLYKPQVFGMLSQTLLDPTLPADVKQTLRQNFPEETKQIPQLTGRTEEPSAPQLEEAKPAAGAASGPSREQIQQTIDQLEMRFASGEISEGAYEKLVAKWENKLAELDAAGA